VARAASRSTIVATLHFDDMAAITEAFASPEGRAAAADRRVLAAGLRRRPQAAVRQPRGVSPPSSPSGPPPGAR